MTARILLVNPPIFDFSAFDFWLKPYGMLRVAGLLRGQAEFVLFDYLDRLHPDLPPGNHRCDAWGRGEFYAERTEKPACFAAIERHYRRYGLPRAEFAKFLSREKPFDYALVQTGMTYWYPGVIEVFDDLRRYSPATKIVLGGVYATLCKSHAAMLGAELVVDGLDLSPLWRFLGLAPESSGLPLWDLYPRSTSGVLKLADGCPFRCTYCSVPQVYPKFAARPLDRSLAELQSLVAHGVRHVAFYDDALLFHRERLLIPFLRAVLEKNIDVNFYTPNALNARFIDREVAHLMIAAGFKHIYLGFESNAYEWQRKTGGKVYSQELGRAIDHLMAAGARPDHIHAYLIVGHPAGNDQQVEESMHYASSLGIKIMLSEFSPIPATPDGESCRERVDLDEPLYHNKTAFTLLSLGSPEVNRLKAIAADLNRKIDGMGAAAGARQHLETYPAGMEGSTKN